jgi:hypothetical protein
MLFTVRDIAFSEYYGRHEMHRSPRNLRRPILRRRGQVSTAKREANRRNARHSTGPRTAAGKARAARNARRHGLTASPVTDPAFMCEAAALARTIEAPGSQISADPPRHLRAMQIAIAHVQVLRVRRAKCGLYAGGLRWDELTRQLASLDRYERRALAQRKTAMRRFDAEPTGEFSQARQNEATVTNQSEISIGWLKTAGSTAPPPTAPGRSRMVASAGPQAAQWRLVCDKPTQAAPHLAARPSRSTVRWH